jgi:hypothetical protein
MDNYYCFTRIIIASFEQLLTTQGSTAMVYLKEAHLACVQGTPVEVYKKQIWERCGTCWSRESYPVRDRPQHPTEMGM